jgi:hypothetical protein
MFGTIIPGCDDETARHEKVLAADIRQVAFFLN